MTTMTAIASLVERKDFGTEDFEAQVRINKIIDGRRLKKKNALEKWIGNRVIVTFATSANVPNGVKSIKGIFFGFSYGAGDTDIRMDLREVEYFRYDRPMMGSKEFLTSLDNIETVELV